MSLDENLAQTLFERGASKCESAEERLAFCKAYMKKNGVDVDALNESIKKLSVSPEPVGWSSSKDIYTFAKRVDVTRQEEMAYVNTEALKSKIKADILYAIAKESYDKGLVQIHENKNFAEDKTTFLAMCKFARW